jgi:hypothetical protein
MVEIRASAGIVGFRRPAGEGADAGGQEKDASCASTGFGFMQEMVEGVTHPADAEDSSGLSFERSTRADELPATKRATLK